MQKMRHKILNNGLATGGLRCNGKIFVHTVSGRECQFMNIFRAISSEFIERVKQIQKKKEEIWSGGFEVMDFCALIHSI